MSDELQKIIDKLKASLAGAIRLGLAGDKQSLGLLARQSAARYKMQGEIQPVFDRHPEAHGSPLRGDAITGDGSGEALPPAGTPVEIDDDEPFEAVLERLNKTQNEHNARMKNLIDEIAQSDVLARVENLITEIQQEDKQQSDIDKLAACLDEIGYDYERLALDGYQRLTISNTDQAIGIYFDADGKLKQEHEL